VIDRLHGACKERQGAARSAFDLEHGVDSRSCGIGPPSRAAPQRRPWLAGTERAAGGHTPQTRQCWNRQFCSVKSPPCYDCTTVESGQWRSDFLAACTTGTGRGPPVAVSRPVTAVSDCCRSDAPRRNRRRSEFDVRQQLANVQALPHSASAGPRLPHLPVQRRSDFFLRRVERRTPPVEIGCVEATLDHSGNRRPLGPSYRLVHHGSHPLARSLSCTPLPFSYVP